MKDDYLVSVVVLTWNRVYDLMEMLSEVKKSTYKYIEIIVVDNASTDGTSETVREKYPDVNLIVLDSNTGIAGYNRGIKKAKGDYIVLFDSDSFPAKYTIEKMVNYFKNEPSLGVAAFDVNNYYYADEIITREKQPTGGIEATGYNGAGVGFRKECLEKAGLLFEKFFLYMNEQEHSLRILKTGYKIKLFPDLTAFHKQSYIARNNEKMAYYYTRNLLWLTWMHYPAYRMIVITTYIFFNISVNSFRRATGVYFKAAFDAINDIESVWQFRSPLPDDIIKKVRLPFNLAFTVF